MLCSNLLLKRLFRIFIIALAATNILAQQKGKNLVKENYIVGNSSELITIRTQNDTVEFRIFDANGSINEGGILETEHRLILDHEWQVFDYNSPVSILSGDFDGDRYKDLIAAWEASDTNVALYIPQVDPVTLKISSEQKIHLTETGVPEMYYTNGSLPSLISLKKGQFDDDREDEIVIAYMAKDEDPDGGPVFIGIYDLDSGEPVLKTSIFNVMLKPNLHNAPNGISRGSLFDVASGDFNQDGLDELVLAAVTPYPDNDDWGWRLDVYLYEIQDGNLEYMYSTDEPIFVENSNSSDYFRRLAIVCGNFDNDFYEDIAITYQVVETGNGDSDIYLRGLKINSDGFGTPGGQYRFDGSNGSNGWPNTMQAGDADYNGLDEVHLAARNTLRSFWFDENMNVLTNGPAPVYAGSLNTNKNDAFTCTFAATDMDIAENDSLKMEIATIDNRGLVIYQKNASGYFDELLEVEDIIASGIAAVDFDGDALRLGQPRTQRITNIVQPVLYLSTPPVHFDIFGDEVFDLQDCYPIYEAGENCESSSVYYTNIEEQTIESSVEIRSTWTKTDLPVSVGPAPGLYSADYAEIMDRVINKEFNKIYGGEEVERNRSSQTFTFSSRAETTEDDHIQCLITEYELVEYPLYSDDYLVKYVLLIEPSQSGVVTRTQWLPFRNSASRNFHPSHEVGNILSYPKTTELPPNAVPFGIGGYSGGLDTWTVSASTSGNWNIKFSSETITERESTASQKVSNDIRGSVTGGASAIYVYGEVHLDFEYLDNKSYEDIRSVKTSIKESSEINVSIGKINTGLIGTKTYDVTPFIYWDAGGALILDYAVSPDFSAGVPSFWEERYGQLPDLTFNLPWRYAGSRGLGGSDDDLQTKQSYDIVLSKFNLEEGDTTDIFARIQNYSNVDASDVSVRFYLGDPDDGGLLIQNIEGKSIASLDQVNAREPVIARLDDWIVPGLIEEETKIFAVIDGDNLIEEVHENNNKAWNLIRQGFGNPTALPEIQPDKDGSENETYLKVYPNPVNGTANFDYRLRIDSEVEIFVYSIQGTLVKVVQQEHVPAGQYSVILNTDNLDAGLYYYTFSTENTAKSGKLIVM